MPMTQSNSTLYSSPDFARFYDLENGWADDFNYCCGLAKGVANVLDLGCGTGELAVSLSKTCAVTAVDPASAMLDIARARDPGSRVNWVQSDARTLRLDQKFDLITLTSHSFQVFITNADQAATLRTIAAHLSPNGRFIFDMRNKAVRPWEDWIKNKTRRHFTDPKLGPITAWASTVFDPDIAVATYTTTFQIDATGQQLRTSAKVRFSDRAELQSHLTKAGLSVQLWLGDWTGSAWTPHSTEIIPLGGLA